MPQLRSVAFSALYLLLVTLFSPSFVAAQSTASPQPPARHAVPATKHAQQKSAAAGNTNASPKPGCATGPIELEFLAPSDSQGLANMLNTIFRDVKVEPGSNSGAKTAGTLCVKDRTTEKYLTKCDPTKAQQSTGATFCAVERVVDQLDIEAFKGGKLNSNYIIHLPGPNPPPTPLYSVATALRGFFTHPAPNLELRQATQDSFFLVPTPGGAEQAAKLGEDLSAQAGLVRRDLEQLNQLYLDATSDSALKNSLLSDMRQICIPNPPKHDEKAEVDAEQWLAKYTVRLSILKPRNAALALRNVQGWTFQVRSYGQAISILPADLPNLRSCGAYLAADAIERDALYHQKLDEEKAATAPKSSDTTGKPPTPASATTTTQSTTTLETLSGGKPSAPSLTTKVTTTTGPAPNPPSGSAPATTTPKTSAGDSGSATGGSNTGATQTSPPGGASDTKSADNPPTPASPDMKGTGSTPLPAPPTPSQQTLRLDNVVRLFHLRQADKIAAAINASSKTGPLVQAVDDNGNNDVILILPSPSGGPDQTTSIRRSIAMFDLPRPQLSLQVWSYQMSAEKKPLDIDDSHNTA
ncbi:MAG: hypothetical protein WB780_12345, partial [Candidatus Acidiferrales bacterium]